MGSRSSYKSSPGIVSSPCSTDARQGTLMNQSFLRAPPLEIRSLRANASCEPCLSECSLQVVVSERKVVGLRRVGRIPGGRRRVLVHKAGVS